MTDLVKRLRIECEMYEKGSLYHRAADEIDRLRSELAVQCHSQISAVDAMLRAEQEVERLKAALEVYACPGLGNCREPKLDDGSCLVEASGGRCGDEAYCALRALEEKQ